MIPFLRSRPGESWWKVGIGFAYLPAIVLVVTVEIWMNLDQSVIWISLGVFYVGFMVFLGLIERKVI